MKAKTKRPLRRLTEAFRKHLREQPGKPFSGKRFDVVPAGQAIEHPDAHKLCDGRVATPEDEDAKAAVAQTLFGAGVVPPDAAAAATAAAK